MLTTQHRPRLTQVATVTHELTTIDGGLETARSFFTVVEPRLFYVIPG